MSASEEPATAGSPPKDGPSLGERIRAAPVTFALAAINVVVFVVAERYGSTQNTGTLLRFGAIEPIHVWAGEYWRLGAYMFLHIGWMHLLWNTYGSIGWCAAVERALGRWRFSIVYLLSGIGGGCVSVIFSPAVSAGASGACFGIVGATLALRRRQLPSLSAFLADRPTRATLLNIAIWTAIGVTALSMNHYAHFGGLAIGALSTWIVTSTGGRTAKWGAFAVAFAALLVCAARPWWKPQGEDATRVAAFAAAYLDGGHGLEQDPARGRAILRRACAKGLDWACTFDQPEGRGGPTPERPAE